MRARYYNPAIRRFINQDVLFGELNPGISLNRFAYANSNPISLVDPFGLCAQSDDLVTSVTNLFRAWYEMIESGIAAFPVAMLAFVSPDLLESLPILAEGLEGGATFAVEEGAVAAEEAAVAGEEAAVAAEGATTVLYHGTSAYTAMEAVENQAINIERLAAHQADKVFASGLYTTMQESTAKYYSNLLFRRGVSGGPAILKIEVPTSIFEEFAAARNISIETRVPRMPGQTETFIPMEHLPAFNDLPGLKLSIHE
jgi:hypothetical protein